MQQAIQISARLYECRDTAKLLLGQRYSQEMEECGNMLKEASRLKGTSILDTAKSTAEKSQAKGDSDMVMVFIFAAAVELLEPSNSPN